MILKAENLGFSAGGRELLHGVSFTLDEHDWLMICGPNGAGKTTLLRCVSGETRFTGSVTLAGENVRALKPALRARLMGMLSQSGRAAYAYTVEEVVRMGRYARRSLLGAPDPGAEEALAGALRLTGMEGMRGRSVLTLSAGEYQRCLLAQALCQDPLVLLLDEPASHLDLRFQRDLYRLVDAWRREKGRAVISVEHSLTAARRWGTKALLLSGGEALAFGPVREALSDEALRRAWDMDVAGWMRGEAEVWEAEA